MPMSSLPSSWSPPSWFPSRLSSMPFSSGTQDCRTFPGEKFKIFLPCHQRFFSGWQSFGATNQSPLSLVPQLLPLGSLFSSSPFSQSWEGIFSESSMKLTQVSIWRKSTSFCDPPPLLSHGAFAPDPRGAHLSCHPLFKASMENAVTCGWFFGAEGVVDITPLYHLNSHHATHLTNYTNLSCTLQLEVKYYN